MKRNFEASHSDCYWDEKKISEAYMLPSTSNLTLLDWPKILWLYRKLIFSNRLVPAWFPIILSFLNNLQLSDNNCNRIADVWVRSADIWHQKWWLCLLHHYHGLGRWSSKNLRHVNAEMFGIKIEEYLPWGNIYWVLHTIQTPSCPPQSSVFLWAHWSKEVSWPWHLTSS